MSRSTAAFDNAAGDFAELSKAIGNLIRYKLPNASRKFALFNQYIIMHSQPLIFVNIILLTSFLRPTVIFIHIVVVITICKRSIYQDNEWMVDYRSNIECDKSAWERERAQNWENVSVYRKHCVHPSTQWEKKRLRERGEWEREWESVWE